MTGEGEGEGADGQDREGTAQEVARQRELQDALELHLSKVFYAGDSLCKSVPRVIQGAGICVFRTESAGAREIGKG